MASEENDVYSSPLIDHEASSEPVNIGSVPIPADFDSWTKCKKQAWLQLESNPNSFFYRHVLPGEEKKNGPWTEKEKEMFIEAIKVHPPSGHWGIFSRNIPGRVGYQCSAFYKKLLSTGEIDEKTIEVNPDIISTINMQCKDSASATKKKRSQTVQFNGSDYAYMFSPTETKNFLVVPENDKKSDSNPFVNNPDVFEKMNKSGILLHNFA